MSNKFSPPSLNRRDALRVLSGMALSLIGSRWVSAASSDRGVALPSAALTPELTEGPYYIDVERIRRDITEGKPGVPLRMRFQVVHVSTGAPIPNAAVDLWHCDAQGVYSGFSGHPMPSPGHGAPPIFSPGQPPPGRWAQDGKSGPPPTVPGGPGHGHKPDNSLTFLRGVQITDASGCTEIETIFPGWYAGRTTHIHVRVHLGGLAADGRYQGGHISHTGQIFLPEDVTTHVYQLPAYAKISQSRISLDQDGIFNQGGSQSMTRLTLVDSHQIQSGLIGDTLLVLDPALTPRPT